MIPRISWSCTPVSEGFHVKASAFVAGREIEFNALIEKILLDRAIKPDALLTRVFQLGTQVIGKNAAYLKTLH